MNKYAVTALLALGLIGSAQADNAVIDSLRVSAADQTSAPWINMPRDEAKPLRLNSDDVENDIKHTEQRLQVELAATLAETAAKALPTN
jgi:hypothetical protein